MDAEGTDQLNTYRILVAETLDLSFADWFGHLTVTPQENGKTTITGTFIDQPALRGFLEQLWNLNITVLSIERMRNGK